MIPQRALVHAAASGLADSLVAGCAATPSRVDPFEPMNRAFYEVHDAVDTVVMTGAAAFGAPGFAATTCENWTQTTGTTTAGGTPVVTREWFGGSTVSCSSPARLYCLQD